MDGSTGGADDAEEEEEDGSAVEGDMRAAAAAATATTATKSAEGDDPAPAALAPIDEVQYRTLLVFTTLYMMCRLYYVLVVGCRGCDRLKDFTKELIRSVCPKTCNACGKGTRLSFFHLQRCSAKCKAFDVSVAPPSVAARFFKSVLKRGHKHRRIGMPNKKLRG